MPQDPLTDQADFRSLQEGDAGALNRLIHRWQRPLYGFAFRYCQNRADAEDLVLETFVRLYKQRLRLRADTKLSAWLFTTLSNLCHNHHRWKKRHPSASGTAENGARLAGAELGEPVSSPGPLEAMERAEALRTLRAAIDQLPHDLKTTLLLHHYDNMSYREISEACGCSERGVETRLYRARQKLRGLLGQCSAAPDATKGQREN